LAQLQVDPGVRVRRRISFDSTNLIGSSQDDGKFTSNFESKINGKVRTESEL
jgi:hypothetical protein